jgi:hypothetical protein
MLGRQPQVELRLVRQKEFETQQNGHEVARWVAVRKFGQEGKGAANRFSQAGRAKRRVILCHLVLEGRRLLEWSLSVARETAMNTIRVETIIEADGELRLTELPCRRGDKVEAILLIRPPSAGPATDAEREKARAAAAEQFLKLARSSLFCSADPYPTRDELHERP